MEGEGVGFIMKDVVIPRRILLGLVCLDYFVF